MGRLLLPSFCHAHVHLDKCFILQEDKFKKYKIESGDFDEAMKITSEAKAQFDASDIRHRGCRLIEESIAAGVTSMRVFVEVDEIVQMEAVEAALALKRQFGRACYLQICAFAQLALFVPGELGWKRRRLLSDGRFMLPTIYLVQSTLGDIPPLLVSTDGYRTQLLWRNTC